MNRPRRVGSPPFGYAHRPGPEFSNNDPYGPPPPHQQHPQQFDQNNHSEPPYMEPIPPQNHHEPHYPASYRDQQRLPSAYRAPIREPHPVPSSTPSYKILCITNINPKIGDALVKEAIMSEFGRFGEMTVGICHDSGERLVYIYFRSYPEAREARHAKSRSLLFDRPIEIEPIYEPRPSPPMSPSMAGYPRRKSMTPPEYYGVDNMHDPNRFMAPFVPTHRRMSPQNYMPSPRSYPMGPGPVPVHASNHGRYYPSGPPHQPPQAPPLPYSPPPNEHYRSYQHSSPVHMGSGHPYPVNHGPPRERERVVPDPNLVRSSRHDMYHNQDYRSYPTSSAYMLPRASSSIQQSPNHYQYPEPNLGVHRQPAYGGRRASPLHQKDMDPVRFPQRDYRRDKFLDKDRDDSKPSRVILITNVDPAKTDEDLKEIFDTFGTIEDLEVKKINADMASALVKFSSMDCAYRAKTAMNGKYLGNLKCRIIYGKVSTSRKLWIGGLGPSTTVLGLDEEFSKFGTISSLDYSSGRPYAYVEYGTSNQAQFASMHLKGSLIAGADRRIRIECVDPERKEKLLKGDTLNQASDNTCRYKISNDSYNNSEADGSPRSSRKRSISPLDTTNPKRVHQASEASTDSTCYETNANRSLARTSNQSTSSSPIVEKPAQEVENNNNLNLPLPPPPMCNEQDTDLSNMVFHIEDFKTLDSDKFANCKKIKDVCEVCDLISPCQLTLRNFSFPSDMILFSGDRPLVEKLIQQSLHNTENGSGVPVFNIKQRWRLNPQPLLDEVKRRMQTGNLGMILFVSKAQENTKLNDNSEQKQNGETNDAKSNDDKSETLNEKVTTGQPRHLKSLINYLEQKVAAGVISLANPNATDQNESLKLLYAFTPCQFALDLILKVAPNLSLEVNDEEYLLGVIVDNSVTKS